MFLVCKPANTDHPKSTLARFVESSCRRWVLEEVHPSCPIVQTCSLFALFEFWIIWMSLAHPREFTSGFQTVFLLQQEGQLISMHQPWGREDHLFFETQKTILAIFANLRIEINPGATAEFHRCSMVFTHPKRRMKVVATVCCTVVPILLFSGKWTPSIWSTLPRTRSLRKHCWKTLPLKRRQF